MAKHLQRIGRFISDKLLRFEQSVDSKLRGTSYSSLRTLDHTESIVDDSPDQSSEYDDTESTGSHDDVTEANVVQFGSSKGLSERFTYNGKQDYPFVEKEIDQQQTKLEARPLETIKKTKAKTLSPHKRMKVDPLTDKQKRKRSGDSSDDADDERDDFRKETSDYFSNEEMTGKPDTKQHMLRTRSGIYP